MALVPASEYAIKPEAAAAPIDTSDWPLLLKNYSDRMQALAASSMHTTNLVQYSSEPHISLPSLQDARLMLAT